MKRKNLIAITSLLLSAMLLLVSCGDETTDAPQQDEPTRDIPTAFESYFDTSFVSDVESLKEALRYDGEFVSAYKGDDCTLLLIKESRIDELNRVCETFKIYNVEKGEIITPVGNVFERVGEIPENDSSSNLDKQINEVRIGFEEISELPLVWVGTTVREKIDEEAKKEDDNIVGDYITVSDTFVLYDIYGNEVTEYTEAEIYITNPKVDRYNNDIRLELGKTVAVFDGTSYKLLNTFDGESDIIYSSYDYVNESYYYYGSDSSVIKVYNKENTLVYSRAVSDKFDYFVLNNGNILLQQHVPVIGEGTGDYFRDDLYINLRTFIIDVVSGKEVELDTNLVVLDLYTEHDLERYDYPVTENTKNLVVAYDIEKEQISSEKMKLIVCDNDFNVIMATEEAYPIQTNPLEFESLYGGYFALGLSSVADRVIISPEGETVSFLREGLDIRDGFIVSNEAIYDYNLETLYSFKENEVMLVTTVGNSVIVVNKPTVPKPGETAPEYIKTYKRINITENGAVIDAQVFDSNYNYVGTYGNVIVMRNVENGKCTAYNYKCEHILTVDRDMEIYVHNGKHVAVANSGGIKRVYVFN